MITVHNIQPLCGEDRQISVPVQPLPEGLWGQVGDGLQNQQFLLHLGFHLRPGLLSLPDHADVGILVVVDDVLNVARQRPLFRSIKGRHECGVLGDGISGGVFPAVQIVGKSRHHRITEQRPENRQ